MQRRIAVSASFQAADSPVGFVVDFVAAQDFVERDSKSDADVERAFQAAHRKVNGRVAQGTRFPAQSIDFVAHHKRERKAQRKVIKRHAVACFFDRENLNIARSQIGNRFARGLEVSPRHDFDGSQSGFRQMAMRRARRVAAQKQLGQTRAITRAEHRTDVVGGTNAVEHGMNRQAWRFKCFLHRHAIRTAFVAHPVFRMQGTDCRL